MSLDLEAPPVCASEIARPEGTDFERSCKAVEVEGWLDLLFYRPLGLRLARLLAAAKFTPDAVTCLATICGVVAGHLYFYRALGINVVGMVLHVLTNLLDNVDGQLARLTNRQSETGKVLDGIGDHLVFVSVYVHITLRHIQNGGSRWMWLVALAAALCHALQSATTEFCRDAYTRFACGRSTNLQSSAALRRLARSTDLRGHAVERLLLSMHGGYVRMQETALPRLGAVRDTLLQCYSRGVPQWLEREYRFTHRHIARRSRLLGTSARMLALFIVLLAGRPTWFFFLELTIFNAVFVWLAVHESRASAQILRVVAEDTRSCG